MTEHQKEHSQDHTGKSAKLLHAFHRRLEKYGFVSQLHLFVDPSTRNHIHIDAVRVKTNLDVTVTDDFQLEITLPDQRCRIAPDDAIDLIVALAKKGSA